MFLVRIPAVVILRIMEPLEVTLDESKVQSAGKQYSLTGRMLYIYPKSH